MAFVSLDLKPLLALEHLKYSEKYGLVISDLMMPEMNGCEFIKKIRVIKPEVKVFFMTAFEINDLEFKRVLPSIKINEFIQKPISPEKLIASVQNYIKV